MYAFIFFLDLQVLPLDKLSLNAPVKDFIRAREVKLLSDLMNKTTHVTIVRVLLKLKISDVVHVFVKLPRTVFTQVMRW